MRRILATAMVVAAVGGFALLTGAASDDQTENPSYWVELDNAFGIIPGADFKIAGVRAGKITEMKIDRESHRALVGFQITQRGFTLKTDVTCESRPQSLIGEYFIDCQPGRNSTVLKPGSTIPVSRTFSTIPADLVNNILRLPQRERLRIILTELGVALSARGEDLNDVLRRAVPALRETDRLLDLLADENQTLEQLTANADIVVAAINGNRKQLTRFVREARDTSAASADRQAAIRQSFRLLPGFLRELRPTMVDLGKVADEQIPTLRDLDAASGNLKTFLEELIPFSEASRPSLATLGGTAEYGRGVIPPATETIQELNQQAGNLPELSRNLAIILNDLYDRDRAVEKDPRSPGGKGYNGFEALLRYVWAQSQAINIFDRNGYILKVAVYFIPECRDYHDQSVKDEPEVIEKCASALGPTQPGINAPDPSRKKATTGAGKDPQQHALKVATDREDALLAGQRAAGPSPQTRTDDADTQQAPRADGKRQNSGPPVDIVKSLQGLMGGAQASPARSRAPGTARATAAQDQTQSELLNFLFAP